MIEINADDFGMDESATMAILSSFEHGWITRTTLMVNMPWADKAVSLARSAGIQDKVGLHFNITEGTPLTERIRECREFCGEDGLFNGAAITDGRFLKPYSVRATQALTEEAEAQVKRYVNYELPLLHCDSHHHVHTRYPTARVLLPILAKYGFKSIRHPYSIGFGVSLYDALRKVKNYLFRRMANSCQLSYCRKFGGIEEFANVHFEVSGNAEFMVHPRMVSGRVVNVVDINTGEGEEMQTIASLINKAGTVLSKL